MAVVLDAHGHRGNVREAGRSRPIASISFFEARLPACVLSNVPADAAPGRVDLVQEGEIVLSQDGRQAVLGAGDVAFLDGARPFRGTVAEGVRLVGVLFPLRLVPVPRDVLRRVTATRVDGRSVSGAMLASFLAALGPRLDSVAPGEEAGISSAAGDLLTAALAHLAGHAEDADRSRSALVARIRRFVETEISDPGLGPARIAAAHHVSVRLLHRLFEGEDMTVAQLVRTRRLEGSRCDLADPALRDLSIGAVAARWGITDSARFSHVFRATYGLSPRQYRAEWSAGAYRQENVR